MSQVSIIIPTYNEEHYLSGTLECLLQLSPAAEEIIVVDGGSTDQTRQVARKYPVILLPTPQAQRSVQMNEGAQVARGQYLCFLHADTLLPSDAMAVIQRTLAKKSNVLGGFISLMKGKRFRWFTSLQNYLKTYYAPLLYRPDRFFFQGLRLLFGDQVLFCRRSDFLQCGGFDPKLPIMEEADLCLKMNQLGHIKQVHRFVISSDRRLAKWGPTKSYFTWTAICILWAFRVSPRQLKKLYEEVR